MKVFVQANGTEQLTLLPGEQKYGQKRGNHDDRAEKHPRANLPGGAFYDSNSFFVFMIFYAIT
jgi:hypothetical protein